MRNVVILPVVLLVVAANALSEEPKAMEQGKAEPGAVAGGKSKGPQKELAVDLGKGVKLEMVLIPAGTFMMGSPDSDTDGTDGQKPQRRVHITKPFFLGKYSVTQEQWQTIMGNNPSQFKGSKNPVENVSWEDSQQFLKKLNARMGVENGTFMLPTEAQWEYACRAGTASRYYFGDDESRLGDYAWYDLNSGSKPHPVGQKKPNPWGLFDMHGNVLQWCADPFEQRYYSRAPDVDPTGPKTGLGHVHRGGGCIFGYNVCDSAYRCYSPSGARSYDIVGFRVARTK